MARDCVSDDSTPRTSAKRHAQARGIDTSVLVDSHSLLQGKAGHLMESHVAKGFVKKCDTGRDSQDQRLIFRQAVRAKARRKAAA
jgi:hypothetical protein